MTRNPVPVAPDIAQRLISQLRTYPPGEGRTAAEIAGQMVSMDAQSVLGYLKTLGSAGIVLADSWPAKPATKWRLG